MNLQLFADQGDRREAPTGKRRGEARKKGQVAQSRELNLAIGLLVSYVTLRAVGGNLIAHLEGWLVFFFKAVAQPEMSGMRFQGWMAAVGRDILAAFLPVLLVPMVAGIGMTILQRGFIFRLEALSPQLEKLNPIAGLGRFFSLNAFVELAKGLFKVAIIGYLLYSAVSGFIPSLVSIFGLGLDQGIALIGVTMESFLWKAILLTTVLAAADYGYQRWQNERGLKMTKQEVKDEAREADLPPEIKRQIKTRQRLISRRRMMAMVAQADVIITNPTHLAVALRYDPKQEEAPVCLAKGADLVALRIREKAQEHGVEIVEDKPLAQALFRYTEVGGSIPAQFYQAVAEILAYVYRRSGKRSFG